MLQLSRFGADWRMENDEGKMRSKKRKIKKRVKRNKKVITGLARDKNGKRLIRVKILLII
jgi:phosphopantothenoylcysteine synthetase/decarboxylase